jgi:hypothetical protein
MVGEQLDLLTWKPPCEILAFPLCARREKVRAVAQNLLRKHEKAAEVYWKQTVSTLGNQLDRLGIERPDIDAQLRTFFHAVQSEMIRLTHEDRGHGGAA